MDIASLCDRQLREWQSRANCMGVDPDLFFPERGASTREAKEVCRGCVVREDCLGTRWRTERSSGSGVGSPSVSAAG